MERRGPCPDPVDAPILLTQRASGARARYLLVPDQASFHFTQSPDRRTFAGDGSAAGKWISLLMPRTVATSEPGLITPGILETKRLASLATHDSTREPNEHYTPDGRWIVYRTNMEGAPAVYAVSTDTARERPSQP